jgi:hypothetical protein
MGTAASRRWNWRYDWWNWDWRSGAGNWDRKYYWRFRKVEHSRVVRRQLLFIRRQLV